MTFERLTAAGIADISLAAVRVLEEHGIDYCAADSRSLQEICRDRNLDLTAISEQLSGASAGESPDRDWTSEPLRELMSHLVVCDHTHFRSELAVLGRRLARVIEHSGDANPQLKYLTKVFYTLQVDLETHMKYEEAEVFPVLERYIRAEESGEPLQGSPLAIFGGPLRIMELEHETTGAALRLMREFADNYQPPEDGCPRYKALLKGLKEFETRLLRHVHLENNVLFPRCAALKAARCRGLPINSLVCDLCHFLICL